MSIARRSLLRAAAAPFVSLGFGACAPPIVIDNKLAEVTARQLQERRLINRRPGFTLLAQYDTHSRRFADAELVATSSLLMVHLWSIYCPPCRAELPLLPALLTALQLRTRMRMVFIAENTQSDMQTFFREHIAEMPRVEHFIISSESRLRADLNETAQPLTLLLDENLVVREGFIGPLVKRREELQSAALRLASSLIPPRGHREESRATAERSLAPTSVQGPRKAHRVASF